MGELWYNSGMSDVGERMIAELKGLREDLREFRAALGQAQPLGFGKLEQPLYLFVNKDWWKDEDKPYVLYTKREGEARVPIFERDVTAYLRNVYRRDQINSQTEKVTPVLDVELFAGRAYTFQTWFYSNVAISLLAALNELKRGELDAPVTLLFETSPGKRSYATVFCRLIVQGKRLDPKFDKKTDVKALYETVLERFGFGPWRDLAASAELLPDALEEPHDDD
jgi:hypothetical protein